MASIKSVERDLTLAIPYTAAKGYICPKCLTAGKKVNYCPKCGQKIKLIDSDGSDWAQLLKDVGKIPGVIETDIVTSQIDFSCGYENRVRYINGVFLERMKAYNDKNAQIEGQLSLF